MEYQLVIDVMNLVHQFELENHKAGDYSNDVAGFRKWVCSTTIEPGIIAEPKWEGKENGRSSDSVINTFIVHMNRYAKYYSKSAINGSAFSTQEDFIYLINLKAFGAMSKIELIKKNVHDKSAGIQIINRLIQNGWAEQTHSEVDKRSKVIQITPAGINVLEKQMEKIRKASQVVTGNLTHAEKMDLIRLLSKLDDFHHSIYCMNVGIPELLELAHSRLSQLPG